MLLTKQASPGTASGRLCFWHAPAMGCCGASRAGPRHTHRRRELDPSSLVNELERATYPPLRCIRKETAPQDESSSRSVHPTVQEGPPRNGCRERSVPPTFGFRHPYRCPVDRPCSRTEPPQNARLAAIATLTENGDRHSAGTPPVQESTDRRSRLRVPLSPRTKLGPDDPGQASACPRLRVSREAAGPAFLRFGFGDQARRAIQCSVRSGTAQGAALHG